MKYCIISFGISLLISFLKSLLCEYILFITSKPLSKFVLYLSNTCKANKTNSNLSLFLEITLSDKLHILSKLLLILVK